MINVMGCALREAADMGDLTVDTLMGRNQTREVVLWRDRALAAAKLIRPSLSLAQLGRACGGRDHATVLHALRRQAARQALDPAEVAMMERLKARVTAASRMEALGVARTTPTDSARRRLEVEIADLEARLDGLRAALADLDAPASQPVLSPLFSPEADHAAAH